MAGFVMDAQVVQDEMVKVLVTDVPVRAVSDAEFIAVVQRVSGWTRASVEELGDGRESRLFMGEGDDFGQGAVVMVRQTTRAAMRQGADKSALVVTREAGIESVDLFSWDDLVGERIVPATLMEEV